MTSVPDSDPPEFEPLPSPRALRPGPLGWIAIGVVLVLFLTVGVAVQTADVGFGLWFTEIFVILGTAWVLVRASGRDPPRYARLDHPPWAPMVLGLALGVVNYFAVVIPLQFFSISIFPEWLRVPDESRIFLNRSPFELFLVLTSVCLVAPFCEEFLFRGVFQRGLMQSLRRPLWAVAIAAAIFSAFHFDVVGFPARFELGVLFGVLLIRYDSVWPGMLAHAGNNLVPTVLYFAAGGAAAEQAQAQAQPSIDQVLQVGLWGTVLLALVLLSARLIPQLAPRRHEPAPPPRLPEPPSEASAEGAQRLPRGAGHLSRAALPWLACAFFTLAIFAIVEWLTR